MNSSSTRHPTKRPTKRQLGRTNQNQNQNQTSIRTGSNEPGDCVPDGYHELMGVCREVGLTDMGRNGSVLKTLLQKYKCRELEAVIRGLRMVKPEYRSILPLNSAQYGEGVWAEAAQRYYRSVNKRAPKRREHESTRIGSILKQLADAS